MANCHLILCPALAVPMINLSLRLIAVHGKGDLCGRPAIKPPSINPREGRTGEGSSRDQLAAEQRPPRLINTATQERGRSSGLADGFDLARLDGTYAVLRLSAETEQRPEVKFRSGCWWMLAVNQVLLLLGNTSQQAHQ